jgi:hypothetical protein
VDGLSLKTELGRIHNQRGAALLPDVRNRQRAPRNSAPDASPSHPGIPDGSASYQAYEQTTMAATGRAQLARLRAGNVRRIGMKKKAYYFDFDATIWLSMTSKIQLCKAEEIGRAHV